MQIQPKHPPRRKRRKVRAYAADITRLQAEGYTCDEIREALADAGIVVSRSTVQREAARASQPTSGPGAPVAPKPPVAAAPPLPPAASPAAATTPPALRPQPALPPPRPLSDDPRTPRQVAEEFMQGQVTNPLLRNERHPP